MAVFINDHAPGRDAVAVTPSDTVAIPGGPARALYVGVAGDVSILTPRGNTVTFVGVPAGAVLPVNATRVNEATTATDIVAIL